MIIPIRNPLQKGKGKYFLSTFVLSYKQKTHLRPVVIVSNNVNNQYSNTLTVLPISSTISKIYPFEVFIRAGESGLKNDSKIKAHQIRTIDKLRIKQLIGSLSNTQIKAVDKAISIHLDLE